MIASRTPKQGRGRPGGPTRSLQQKICLAIRQGNFRGIAAQWAGVKLRTFHRWCQRGREDTRGIYPDFWQAVLEAEKTAEINAVTLIMKAAKDNVKHAEWWLERKYPQRWGLCCTRSSGQC